MRQPHRTAPRPVSRVPLNADLSIKLESGQPPRGGCRPWKEAGPGRRPDEISTSDGPRRDRKGNRWSPSSSPPAHPGAEAHRRHCQQRDCGGEARQFRLHVTPRQSCGASVPATGRSRFRDPWLCVPASRRVCPETVFEAVGRLSSSPSTLGGPKRSANGKGVPVPPGLRAWEGSRRHHCEPARGRIGSGGAGARKALRA
jgi:hypothetical protein